MKAVLFLLILLTNLLSLEIVNGDTIILSMEKQKSGKLYINNRLSKWIPNPLNSNENIAIITADYRDKNNIIVKNIVDLTEEKIILKVVRGKYKKEILNVEPKKVNPPKSVLRRIKKEKEEASLLYSKMSEKFYFNSPFVVPLNSKITSNFGNARIYNKVLKSYHGGVDFRAAVGTEVRSSNDGVVRIAKDRYYAGGSVVVDHGGGIYSQYYHLDKINVKTGQKVKKSQILGFSGATGRVNGPHLHFGIVAGGNSVNPLTFIEKINTFLFGAGY